MDLRRLNEPADIAQPSEGPPITRLMHTIWLSRPDVQAVFDLTSEASRRGFVGWYFASAPSEYDFDGRFYPSAPGNGGAWKKSWRRLALRAQPVVRTVARPLLSDAMRRRLKIWSYQGLARLGAGSADPSHRRPDPAAEPGPLSPGVNVIGYARAELGMGEQHRAFARVMAAEHIPFGNIDVGMDLQSRQRDPTCAGPRLERPAHRANIFHVNADQMLTVFSRLRPASFEGRHNIGCWLWELPRCPAEWAPMAQFVDEIWAASRFVQSAFEGVTGVPVLHMPGAVELDAPPEPADRRRFGLPTDRYLFLFTFDFFSFIDRKNPFACVEAFHRAFPRACEGVGLVIKCMNGRESSPKWKRLMERVNGDPRITIINEVFDKHAVLGLIQACDCFLSLHRSEGFGLGPATAMLLHKPLVVTGYSGNMDFTEPGNACLVRYEEVPVREGEYPCHAGQVWAEPDVEHAAWYMRKLVADPAWGRGLGDAGAATVSSRYNAGVVGRRYRARLETLGLI